MNEHILEQKKLSYQPIVYPWYAHQVYIAHKTKEMLGLVAYMMPSHRILGRLAGKLKSAQNYQITKLSYL